MLILAHGLFLAYVALYAGDYWRLWCLSVVLAVIGWCLVIGRCPLRRKPVAAKQEQSVAIVPYSLELIQNLLVSGQEDPLRTGKVLCFSCPDVLVSRDNSKKILGPTVASKLTYRDDSEAILRWHKLTHVLSEVPDTWSLFHALGFEMTAIDITASRGREIIHDLSLPLDSLLHGRYDLVFDIVSNQVFDVAQAMRNAALACRVGGYVVHVIPMQMVNQGFWSVGPTAYADFYDANGFDRIAFGYVSNAYDGTVIDDPNPTHRRHTVPDGTRNVVVVRKRENVPLTNPVMTKFRHYTHCKRLPGEAK